MSGCQANRCEPTYTTSYIRIFTGNKGRTKFVDFLIPLSIAGSEVWYE